MLGIYILPQAPEAGLHSLNETKRVGELVNVPDILKVLEELPVIKEVC